LFIYKVTSMSTVTHAFMLITVNLFTLFIIKSYLKELQIFFARLKVMLNKTLSISNNKHKPFALIKRQIHF